MDFFFSHPNDVEAGQGQKFKIKIKHKPNRMQALKSTDGSGLSE